MSLFKSYLFAGICAFCYTTGLAQDSARIPKINQFADITITVGDKQGAAAVSWVYNWRMGKSRKFEAGLGIRSTVYYGTKKNYITAPARLSRSTTFPFVIVFAGQETANWDTLTVQRPFTNALNMTGNLGYHLSDKLYAGVNIDLVGFTLGRTTSGILVSDGVTRTESSAKPSAFNLLLTGDNDLGSLNSEFFLSYKISDRLGIKAVYQFLFSEYRTTNIYQTAPDGTQVTRFRNKANNFGAGISYHF